MQPPNNGTPSCQNIMFPPLPLYNYNYNEHSYNQYQPIINIPTRTRIATIGEVGASVELVKAHVLELSKRMESIEYKFSKFEKCTSSDISLLKNTLLEHSTELLKMGDSVDNTLAHVKSINALIERQDACIDKLMDAFYEHNRLYNKRHKQQQLGVATNVDLGMIRRRLSKVEEFTGEFYEQFENFQSVKDIISSLSEHIDECDRDISSIVIKNIEFLEGRYRHESNDIDDDGDIVASALQHAVVSDLDNYFSNYDDNENNNDERDQNILSTFMKNDQEQQNMEEEDDDDFEKL
jgi:hypothetical protein